MAGADCLVYRGEEANARCVEMHAFVKKIGDGGESPSNVATFSAYSVSLSLRKRGKGVRRLLLWTLPKEVTVTPNSACSERWASQGVVSR